MLLIFFFINILIWNIIQQHLAFAILYHLIIILLDEYCA